MAGLETSHGTRHSIPCPQISLGAMGYLTRCLQHLLLPGWKGALRRILHPAEPPAGRTGTRGAAFYSPVIHPSSRPLQQWRQPRITVVLELFVLYFIMHFHHSLHCLLLTQPRTGAARKQANHKCPSENILYGLNFCNLPFSLPLPPCTNYFSIFLPSKKSHSNPVTAWC